MWVRGHEPRTTTSLGGFAMYQMRVRRWALAAAIAAPGLIVALLGAHRAPLVGDELPECPRDWGDRLPKWLGGRRSESQGFTVPGPITDVPEFHDCQRLIQPD